MIRLKKDGKYFDVAVGETITTEWVSTVFNDDAEFNGSYTYPVKAPFTPTNNALLKNAQLIENRSARYATMVTIEIFGRTWKQAKLTFDVTPDGYEMNCLIDNAEFAKLIKEKYLPEIFINFKEGVFADFIYDRLGNTRDETLNTMLTRANYPGTGSCVFFSQKNDGLFGSHEGDTLPYDPNYRINIYNTNADFMRTIFSEANRKGIFYNPSYYLHWVIRQLCTFLGFEAAGDFFTDPATQTLVIDNTGFIDVETLFALDGGKIATSRHLPNIKIPDFIKTLRSTFKLAIYFDGNERKAYFNYAPRIVNGTDGVDISGYTEKGLTITTYVPTGYELEQAIDDNDDLFKTFEYVKSFYIGDNEEPQKLNSFTTTSYMTDVTEVRPVEGSTWRIPRKRQTGNVYSPAAQGTDAYNETGYSKNEFAFRLINYIGMRYSGNFIPYYYASSDGKDTNAIEMPGVLSCWLGGTNGLINRFIKEWLMFYLRTEEVEITAHLPGTVLMQLSPLKKLFWTTHTRARIPAMINQVSFESSDVYAGRISAKIKVYPVYNQAATDVKAFKEFTPGVIENEGKIYVKYRIVETGRDEKVAFGQRITLALFWAGYLDFFSDEACTKPRSVSKMPVNMLYQYRGKNERNYRDENFQVIASGTSHQIQQSQGIDQVAKGGDSKDYWTKNYFLLAGPDYIVK